MTKDIVTRLRAVLHNDRSVELMNREAASEIERLRNELISITDNLRAERDEVRREICDYVSSGAVILGKRPTWQEYAAERGWDFGNGKP